MAEFPRDVDRRVVERLSRLFEAQSEYTFSSLVKLIQQVEPLSAEALGVILSHLAENGVIAFVFRLESPFSHLGLEEFTSVLDIPNRFYDADSEREFDVRPENILPVIKRTEARVGSV